MTASIKETKPLYRATKKDVLGSSFGDLERSVEQHDIGGALKTVKLEYDFAQDGAIAVSGGTVNLRIAGTDEDFTLPSGAQILYSCYRVTTTFTSATDAAQLSIGIPTDDAEGIVAEAAISAMGNVWDSTTKVVAGIQSDFGTGAAEVTTAERNITVKNDNGSEATTAGALYLWISYIVTTAQ